MNATATVWDLDEDFDSIDDMVPMSGAMQRDSGIMRRKSRPRSSSPLERCLEDCAKHGENVVIIEDTQDNTFFQAEDAGTMEILEIVITGRDNPARSGKRARIQLLSRKA
jgi:hypothetical protein